MSIQVLTQVYDEMRRLAIAGSVVAPGDFRLKKLIAPLEQSGAKAPVFAKVADAVKKVVEGDEKTSAAMLLELATLVNAILYTQGETGAAGDALPIETTDMGAMSQTSARMLKPLLEALTTTGAGRLELIKDAFERGGFRDLRLVKPALDAIDDPYGEIGDFIAEKVLPIFGKAILPELRAKLDLKGRAGHPRRLRLLHQLDPAGSRELVKQALDDGSKEVKVVAIECLGGDPADLSYLIEQASAKAQEVRQAAYRALASIDEDDAVAVLQKAMTGKDLMLAADSLRKNRNSRLLDYVIAGAEAELAALPKTKDKKEVSQKIGRLQSLVYCLNGRDDKDSEAFVLKMFAKRDDLAKIKGSGTSGADLSPVVVNALWSGTPKMQTTLAEAHAVLDEDDDSLEMSFSAARRILPPGRVFDMFSPYLTAKPGEKKKKRDKREIICHALGGRYQYWSTRPDEFPPLDSRWLDVAVQTKELGLVRALARTGHTAANAFLEESFAEIIKKAKTLEECHDVVAAMIRSEHAEATDAFIAAFEKQKKSDHYIYWFAQLIPELPRSAIPRLEALVPTLSDRVADIIVDYLQQLRDKK
jgi:HEAT repeats